MQEKQRQRTPAETRSMAGKQAGQGFQARGQAGRTRSGGVEATKTKQGLVDGRAPMAAMAARWSRALRSVPLNAPTGLVPTGQFGRRAMHASEPGRAEEQLPPTAIGPEDGKIAIDNRLFPHRQQRSTRLGLYLSRLEVHPSTVREHLPRSLGFDDSAEIDNQRLTTPAATSERAKLGGMSTEHRHATPEFFSVPRGRATIGRSCRFPRSRQDKGRVPAAAQPIRRHQRDPCHREISSSQHIRCLRGLLTQRQGVGKRPGFRASTSRPDPWLPCDGGFGVTAAALDVSRVLDRPNDAAMMTAIQTRGPLCSAEQTAFPDRGASFARRAVPSQASPGAAGESGSLAPWRFWPRCRDEIWGAPACGRSRERDAAGGQSVHKLQAAHTATLRR